MSDSTDLFADVTLYKRCKGCDVAKLLTEFHRSRGGKFGRATHCRDCMVGKNKAHKTRRKKNGQAYAEYVKRKDRLRSKYILKKYGISVSDYDAMFAAQGGVCAICKEEENRIGCRGGALMLAVDHDHQTGKVRSLLCARCNHGLGNFRDRADLLAAAIAYLKKHDAKAS